MRDGDRRCTGYIGEKVRMHATGHLLRTKSNATWRLQSGRKWGGISGGGAKKLPKANQRLVGTNRNSGKIKREVGENEKPGDFVHKEPPK